MATVEKLMADRNVCPTLAAAEQEPRGEVLPGVDGRLVEDYAVRGATALQPLIDGVVNYAERQTSLRGLGPRLLDAFARTRIEDLAAALHGAMLHAAGSAWSDLAEEIPEARGRLTAGRQECPPHQLVLAGSPGEPLTPERAVDWFRTKNILPKAEFEWLHDQAKLRAWTVAGDLSHHVLARVHESTLDAVREGRSFGEWKRGLRDFLSAEGFTPAAPGHLGTVFENAMHQSYSAERWRGQMACADLRPLWQYKTLADGHVRDKHKAWHDRVFDHRSGFWVANYPPNDHRCRCYAVSLSEAQARDQGLRVERKWSGGPAAEGWRHNPGFGYPAKEISRTYKLGREQPMLGRRSYSLPARVSLVKPRQLLIERAGELREQGLRDPQIRERYLAEFERAAGLDAKRPSAQVSDPRGDGVGVSRGLYDYAVKGNLEAGRLSPLMVEAITDPAEIWLVPARLPNGRLVMRRRYLAEFEIEGERVLVTVMQEPGGATAGEIVRGAGRISVTRTDLLRNGALIYRREQ